MQVKWGGPGATGLHDTIALDSQFQFGPYTSAGSSVQQVHLDPSVVQSWVNDDSVNNGVLMWMSNAGHRVSVGGPGDRYPANRPVLSIKYQTVAPSDVVPRAPAFTYPVVIATGGRLIFVSPSGNDTTATGILSQPYGTIVAALAQAHSGDTIVLRGGVYAGGNIVMTLASVTMTSFEGELATITCPIHTQTPVVVFVNPTCDYCVLRNLEIVGGYYYGASSCSCLLGLSDYSHAD